jgi:hypothetical protein
MNGILIDLSDFATKRLIPLIAIIAVASLIARWWRSRRR